MEDVKALQLIGKLTERFTRICPPTPEYQERLAEEFEIILSLRFTDYIEVIECKTTRIDQYYKETSF